MDQINLEMDDQDVPKDSVLRGLADIQIACQHHAGLRELMSGMYPTSIALMN
jgi:hypothetical protein